MKTTTKTRAWVIGLAALGAAACTADSVVSQAGVPGTRVAASVRDVATRGDYLDASVDAGGFDYRYFFPNDDACRELLENPEGLVFTWLGRLGRIGRDDRHCDAVGVLSLKAWTDRRPRSSREPLARAPASYEVTYRDDALAQLRGRFPLARKLGFTGTGQLVVVVPRDEPCEVVMASDTASMEYRDSGPTPLVLIARDELCAVLGLAEPLPGP